MSSTMVLAVHYFFTVFIHYISCIIMSVHVLHSLTLCRIVYGSKVLSTVQASTLLRPELYLGP